MVKRWLTPHDRPGSHLEFFLKIQHTHGQKMIDPPNRWQTRISSRIFFEDSTYTWSKDDWPPHDRPGSHLEFIFKIQHAHGQKMIDPQTDDRPGSHLEFFFEDSTCAWSKDDWLSPPSPRWQTRISPRIFFKIQHAHGQEMNDPPPRPSSKFATFC